MQSQTSQLRQANTSNRIRVYQPSMFSLSSLKGSTTQGVHQHCSVQTIVLCYMYYFSITIWASLLRVSLAWGDRSALVWTKHRGGFIEVLNRREDPRLCARQRSQPRCQQMALKNVSSAPGLIGAASSKVVWSTRKFLHAGSNKSSLFLDWTHAK